MGRVDRGVLAAGMVTNCGTTIQRLIYQTVLNHTIRVWAEVFLLCGTVAWFYVICLDQANEKDMLICPMVQIVVLDTLGSDFIVIGGCGCGEGQLHVEISGNGCIHILSRVQRYTSVPFVYLQDEVVDGARRFNNRHVGDGSCPKPRFCRRIRHRVNDIFGESV